MRRVVRGHTVLLSLLVVLVIGACGGYVSVGWGYDPCCYYYAADWYAYSLTAGDFDGDRIPDVVVSDGSDGRVYFLKGLGRGQFVTPPAAPVLGPPGKHRVRAGDFDGDSHLDLVIVDLTTGDVRVYFGDGGGGFQEAAPAPPLLTVPMEFVDVLPARVDDDELADLVVLHELGALSVLLGNGDGTFSPAGEASMQSTAPGLVVVRGRFDEGPGLDVAVLDPEHGEVTLLFGSGDGTLAQGPVIPVALPRALRDAVPVEGRVPGRTDIALLSGAEDGALWLRLLFTTGEQAWRLSQPPVPVGAAADAAAADLTGDGITDVILTVPDTGEIRVFVGGPR